MFYLFLLVAATIAIPTVLIIVSSFIRYAYKIGIMRDNTTIENMQSAIHRGHYNFPTGAQASAARRFVPSSYAH